MPLAIYLELDKEKINKPTYTYRTIDAIYTYLRTKYSINVARRTL